MEYFKTYTGELVRGDNLQAALNKVADDWAELAYAIRHGGGYASHVTEEIKEAALEFRLKQSDEIRAGKIQSFTIWQRVNQALTGECVALLNK